MSSVQMINTELPDIIELRDINQTYDNGKTWTIKDVNLLIEDKKGQGEFVVILGKSGCGKSTLLRYITGLAKPTSGQVFIREKERTNNTPKISMVFQQYSSLPWRTVLQNVMLPLEYAGVEYKEAKAQAMVIIETVGLLGNENKFAQPELLSGGQLQRVAIARSLVNRPDIILMDEPFGALDPVTRFDLEQLLAKIWLEIQSTIILVTHDMQEAIFLGDDIYIMMPNPGRIEKSIHVDLPLERDRSIKKTKRFQELVSEVDEAFYTL
jgi:NitT/TauT family transport system ATP-binding protein